MLEIVEAGRQRAEIDKGRLRRDRLGAGIGEHSEDLLEATGGG